MASRDTKTGWKVILKALCVFSLVIMRGGYTQHQQESSTNFVIGKNWTTGTTARGQTSYFSKQKKISVMCPPTPKNDTVVFLPPLVNGRPPPQLDPRKTAKKKEKREQ